MSDEYWLADSEARVLGPIGLEVVVTLHARGKLLDVRAVSRDGRKFVPLREMPELQAVLSAPATPNDAQRAQREATAQIRQWLTSIQQHPTQDIFRVPQGASRDAWRSAFFALVHRYVPSRLPPDTTPELRVACEDAFLALAERMVEIEKQFRAPHLPPPLMGSATSDPPPAARLSHRSGAVHIDLSLKRGDARPFTQDREHSWQNDSLCIESSERLVPGSTIELAVTFEGHVTQLHANGRVATARAGGFTVKLLNLSEDQRALIRTWVARSTLK